MAGDRLRAAAATSAGVTATNAKDLADQLALSHSKEVLAVFSNSIVPSAVPRARYRSSVVRCQRRRTTCGLDSAVQG